MKRLNAVHAFVAALVLAIANPASSLANSPPNPPTLVSPVEAAFGVSRIPTLSWNGSDPDNDVLTYDVYLGRVSDNLPLVGANSGPSSYSGSLLNGGTRYYWRIVARDPSGAEASSVTQTFVTGTVDPPPSSIAVTPQDKSIGQPSSLTFDWQAFYSSTDPTTYFFYLGTTNPPPYYATFTTQTAPITVQRGVQYYWSVVGRTSSGVNTYSPVWRFSTAPDQRPQVTLANPTNQAIDQPFDVSLSWNASDANGDAILFDVYLGTAALSKVASDVSATTFDASEITNMPSTKYYWQIVAKTAFGNTSSPTWSFTTRSNEPPSAASNPSPADGASAANPVQLSWEATDVDLPAQTLTYDIYFGAQPQPPLIQWGLSTPSYDPGPVYPGLTYYWSVTVSDGINVTYGPTWSFVVSTATGVGDAPSVITLGRNHPNPFNPQTIIPYGVPNARTPVRVQLVIYDTLGRVVRTLVDENQSGGYREVVWKGDDQRGGHVSSGVYYCVLHAGNERRTQKLVLLK
jgi:hypothetical protein